MSKGLFFTGVVYKNTRDILKEEEARQVRAGNYNYNPNITEVDLPARLQVKV